MSTAPPKTAFGTDTALRARLDAFLAARSFTFDDLLGEADQGHGEPLLAVAAGSVLAGFGTHRSDLDLLVLVDHGRITRMPITSHRFGTLIDVTVREAAAVRAVAAELATPDAASRWPQTDTVGSSGWNHHRRSLNTVSRLALGLPLKGAEPWRSWLEELRGPWLGDVLARWWVTESLRCRTAAGWLAGSNPRLARVRAREAALHALHARVTVGGEWYFNAKWLPEKLKAVGDEKALSQVRDLLAGDVPLAEAIGRADAALAEADRAAAGAGTATRSGAPGSWQAVVRWAPGVSTRPVDRGTVVDRWGMRALQSELSDLPPAPGTAAGGTSGGESGGEAVVWQGPLDEPPPPEVLRLFVHDMLWLGVAPQTGEVAA